MKSILSLLLVISLSNLSIAQPNIEWEKSLGGTNNDHATSIQQTVDGGNIVAGYTASFNGDVTGNHGGFDMWITKLTSTGSITWQKSLGGTANDFATSIQQTVDGGYIVAGYSRSNDGDVTGNQGGDDMWIVKLTSTGSLTWQKTLGGTLQDVASCIQQTLDGGYIVAGYSYSTNGNVTGNHGVDDMWIVKLSSTGTITWQKSLGGTVNDRANSIQQTSDGGYIVAGYSYSSNGDITINIGAQDMWIVKLSSTGSITWQKTLGGTDNEVANSIQQTSDGGYIVAGYSESNDIDVTGNHGANDMWIVKLTSIGNITWQKSLGGTNYDEASSIQQTIDRGYVVTGKSWSNNGDITGNHGGKDIWAAKLTSTGDITWNRCLGGTGYEVGSSIKQTVDGGYVIAGTSEITNGDVTNNNGSQDMWVIKFSTQVGVNEIEQLTLFNIFPNPTSDQLTIHTKQNISEISIIDITGKTVMATKGNTNTINVADLSDGIYFIQLITDKRTIIKKFVKQ